eukprot:m.105414 g.105414  ORF g.105414 m.105414 type:complete len:426 (+) comp15797_c0_seq1:379-1656(+)
MSQRRDSAGSFNSVGSGNSRQSDAIPTAVNTTTNSTATSNRLNLPTNINSGSRSGSFSSTSSSDNRSRRRGSPAAAAHELPAFCAFGYSAAPGLASQLEHAALRNHGVTQPPANTNSDINCGSGPSHNNTTSPTAETAVDTAAEAAQIMRRRGVQGAAAAAGDAREEESQRTGCCGCGLGCCRRRAANANADETSSDAASSTGRGGSSCNSTQPPRPSQHPHPPAQHSKENAASAGSAMKDWPANRVNGLIHFYRGELGRMVVYRARLDTTTNWAVSTTSVLMVFSMNSDVPHWMFGLILLLNMLFLLIESRRWALFSASQQKVKLMERHFITENLLFDMPQYEWSAQLASLLQERVVRSFNWYCIYVRFVRNYSLLFLLVYCGWIVKLLRDDLFSLTHFLPVTGALAAIFLVFFLFRPPYIVDE